MNKWKKLTVLFLTISIFTFLFGTLRTNKYQGENAKLEDKVKQLEQTNGKLSNNLKEINAMVETNMNDQKEVELSKKYKQVANDFLKWYADFDVNTIEQRRKEMLEIANADVVDKIVPEKMIEDVKKLESDPASASTLQTTDPTYKSWLEDSEVFSQLVSANQMKYFAKVTFRTSSSTGKTVTTTYLQFTVDGKDNSFKVSEYTPMYLN